MKAGPRAPTYRPPGLSAPDASMAALATTAGAVTGRGARGASLSANLVPTTKPILQGRRLPSSSMTCPRTDGRPSPRPIRQRLRGYWKEPETLASPGRRHGQEGRRHSWSPREDRGPTARLRPQPRSGHSARGPSAVCGSRDRGRVSGAGRLTRTRAEARRPRAARSLHGSTPPRPFRSAQWMKGRH